MTGPEAILPSRSVYTPRAYLLYGAGALLALAAIALRDPVPLYLALPLLLAPIAAGVFLSEELPTATLEWRLEGGRSEVGIRGQLVLDRPARPGRVVPVFFRPPPLRETSAPEVHRTVDRVDFTLHYAVDAPCIVQIPPPTLAWQDSLGLIERPFRVQGTPLRVERFPPELRRLDRIRLDRTTSFAGEIRSRAIGATGEFFSIRPSVPGDSVRQINWKATARAGRLLANDRYMERTGDVLLLVEARPTGLGAERDEKLLALARAAALGIADAFLAEKSRVGLGVFTDQLAAIPLATGRLQRYRIAELLRKTVLPGEAGPPERLAVAVRRYFPPGVFTLLLSPMVDSDSVLALPHLRRRGFPAVVLSPSPLPMIEPADPAERDPTATRLLRLVRRRALGEVWQEAPVVEWEDYWSLGGLVDFLRRPVRFGRRT